ncbi:MAG TPA: bifunctional phosphopantothenoylcysteine decarboxylase/phosphopantothenate--cysteine ligase CoaBC [Thermoanaerobaculia bacterium]|nr:bifunctional phosphopantothenoylcysteine decarboxylase/phosphopantothenate--cysteine ligase CoaBC [Thermoanaerobaculia bacterium]
MRVLVGVSGGIAAFKTPHLVRRLRERGHEVRCALTRAGESFVTPLTLEVLSQHRVYTDDYLQPDGSGEEQHIVAAQWADALCVAPATADVLARLALGLADGFLTTVALAHEGRLIVAPAMHSAMWAKPTVQDHVQRLRERGVVVVGPTEGSLASGEAGWGRMVEPEVIVDAVESVGAGDLQGRTVVVTAGPTWEPVDAVRFLANRSSGKMGFALAEEAARRGARSILVAGPVTLPTPRGVERIDVESAGEMEEALGRVAPRADLVIMAAAVSDYRPANPARRKIKKEEGLREIALTENPDLLAGLAERAPRAVRVGFAAETEDLEQNARAKLERKRVDFLVANDVSRSDIGFSSDHNEVVVYGRDGGVVRFERAPKAVIARALLDLLAPGLATASCAR